MPAAASANAKDFIKLPLPGREGPVNVAKPSMPDRMKPVIPVAHFDDKMKNPEAT
ncbi:hypothetical protein QUC32_21710 [Novosphingobium resinovorum]|uniref:hypothetical protein n=1 Tax=Sphingomonadaceae TaxID=41297 RepID=UPI0003147910|nr:MULTISPECIES: hypothetical protein [Sphingomonadaceae]MBF7012267.1 hypothetical protein [Novosphingobium sp. HR1a]WJM27009.1 hypothetical protein QUC32_21710 [Novosphingobium resinovorum]